MADAPGPVQELANAIDIVRAEHRRNVGRPGEDRPPLLLREATADGDLETGLALGKRLQLAEVTVELGVGVLADAAGVENDDIRLLDIRGPLETLGDKPGGDPLRVVLVHLAAECANEELAGHPQRLRAPRADTVFA